MIEQPPKIEIENNIEDLRSLEREGKYVFHGSYRLMTELEPKQPKNLNRETKIMEDHGDPGVAASQYLDLAIFRAVINNTLTGSDNYHRSLFGSRYNNNSLNIYFKTTPEIFEKAKHAKGYVYVFDKNDFVKFDGIEVRCPHTIKPLRVFKVGFKDLPDNIGLDYEK